MALEISAGQRQEMEQHAEETYPYECCGFLVGREEAGVKRVQQVWRATNQREDSPQNRFLIDPGEFLRADKGAQREGLNIVGIYHSHPDHPARPSEFDREHAWPYYSYIIFSVDKGKVVDAHSWVLDEGRAAFDEEPVEGLRDNG